ncbi:MAG: hypothetical protein MK212_21850, partial [Saprospiraceae bacterium]|nr:hypothetical protein [Saprospiraceae bacterium]
MDWYLFDKMDYLDEDGSGDFIVYYLDWVTVISTALIFIYLTLFDRNKNSTSSTSSGDACLTGEEVIEVTPDHK